MIAVTLECSGIRSQTLAENLPEFETFKIWVHAGKVYLRCSVKSMQALNELTRKLLQLKLRFTYIGIEKKGNGDAEDKK